MARSLNKVQLIGNLTRDPELRYTPQGTAVCSFSVATNRSWTTDSGEKKEEADFHRIVAWNKLAEICSQILTKGRKVYVEGRLQTRNWEAQDGSKRQTTEVNISDMIALDSKGASSGGSDFNVPDDLGDLDLESQVDEVDAKEEKKVEEKIKNAKTSKAEKEEGEEDDDIPF